MNFCIYRRNNNCKTCCFTSKYNNYCAIHSNNYNIVYDIINKAIGRNEMNTCEIYNIFKYIYDSNDIYTKEFIFKACLKTLFSTSISLLSHFKDFSCLKNMNDIIENIYKLNMNTYMIEKDEENIKKIKKISNFFNYKNIKKHVYNPDIILNNTEDPFTMDNINDIDKNRLFIYSENNTNYFFIATELKYFIDTNGKWNPYTKQEIPDNIVKNLNIYIEYFKLNPHKKINRFEWSSTHQAYTDVSQIIEKIGFYNDTRWFLKLTSIQIKDVIKTFKVVSRNNEEAAEYFINITDNNIFYDFAREIIRLFENGNERFMLCCNFIKSIALYSDDFYNNIPDWMVDIETPNIITVNEFPPLSAATILNSMEILYFINIMNNE